MLWKKESKRLDSLYVELCDVDENHNGFYSSFSDDDDSTESEMPAKNNALAKHYREKAAEHCESKNWFEAIELYNQALCFAEDDSSAMAAILTNRAQCFLQLKMFDECAVDVKLAKTKADAEIYMAQLNRLSAMCGQKRNQRAKNEQVVHQFQPTLSFDASKQIPCAANVVTIETMTKKATKAGAKCEQIFQATRPIEVGKTILVEDAFVATTIERYKRCCICLKAATNLVPCTECTNSLFCHGTCERKANELHHVECNSFLTKGKNDENNADLVIRSILMAFKVKPSVNGLLQFVEKVLFDKQYDALAGADYGSLQSKYVIFLKNGQKMLHEADTDDDDFTDVIGDIYKTLMDNDEFSARIDLPDHRRFLMHLIGHHMCALRHPKLNVEIGENDGTIVHSIYADFFKHSCYPNVTLVTSDRSVVAVTIRPIQKNEPLTVSYLPNSLVYDIAFARRLVLREKFKIQCKCERCEQKKSETVYNPSKQGLSQQFQDECENDSHFHHKMQKMRKKLTMECVKFLNRNGGDAWNDDVDLVTTTYARLLREKFYLNLQY